MIHHGDLEKALRNMKKSAQYECKVVNKKDFFEKKSDRNRKVRMNIKRRLARIAKNN